MRTIIAMALLTLTIVSTQAQQWGLYTFYATKNGTQAYLIDTNSTNYHTWTFSSSAKSAYSAYLTEDKTIVRTYKPTGAWNGGGCTGGVQKVDWNNNVIWDFQYFATNDYCLHHDICPMPNGNVLMICYDYRSSSEATQAGSSSASAFYSERIIEVQPTGATTGTIVWEWYLWDHMCQSYNSSKDNYVSNTAAHPELMNINYAGTGSLPDRYHMNGIDYNEDLDQIVVSMHFMNSAFVIDHSTTTAEAAGHTGGNSGHGGDFLYRWGNPASYGASGTTFFNVIHDAHWVPSDNPNYPDYLCGYNNQGGTSGKTAVTIWSPTYNGYNYTVTSGVQTPTNYAYQYNSSFSSSNEGNSQQLPNGNMIVNNPFGSIYEINSSGTTLWTKASANSSHAYRYSMCYVRGPVASIAADTDICDGDAVTLNASAVSVTESSPNYSYAWTSSPGGFISGSQNPSATPTSTTTYTVIITNTNIGCSDSATITINVHPQPSAPTITNNGFFISSSVATSYQWYADGSPISGATSQDYTPTQSGSYTVMITDAYGCTATSDPLVFTYTGIETSNSSPVFSLMPNPTSGIISLVGNFSDNTRVEIRNAFGMVILETENTESINLCDFADGLYFVVVKENNSISHIQKVILHK
ncbi:MAG: hypothetical protein CVU11_12265 [Bacteroidetes bacterium HGW-Bacteroidetes-6]|jgi:hypothetical protein|nr:MAG: hypothetical protein CVU11_12265 [Bacteroidetes bacterium HGW-Bacteroidetes-6]